MKPRRFSRKDEDQIDRMIRSICQELLLPEAYADEARSVGWCAFLSVYQKCPALFLWAGNDGWKRAYLEIHAELSAFKAQEVSKYYKFSLDQPFNQGDGDPMQNLIQARHADFRQYICLRDYMQRLPADETWLAQTLSSGYTPKEIPALFHCTQEELTQIHDRLQKSMTQYLEI